MSLNIETIPAFQDNYLWLFFQQDDRQGWVVDPGDAAPVLERLQKLHCDLAGILVTHQHPDHIGGIPQLLNHYPGIPVYGPADISLVNQPVREGDRVTAAGINFEVIAVPGHTLNHLAYYAARDADGSRLESPLLFCGDTLFAGGCGRLFEGTPEQMYDSLNKIAALPENTQVFCAHEYTLANLAFAQAVEPENSALKARVDRSIALRNQQVPTVPSTIGLEKQTNPFLRTTSQELSKNVCDHAGLNTSDPVAVFAATRQWKDNF